MDGEIQLFIRNVSPPNICKKKKKKKFSWVSLTPSYPPLPIKENIVNYFFSMLTMLGCGKVINHRSITDPRVTKKAYVSCSIFFNGNIL